MNKKKFDNKIALITGGTSGIGFQIAMDIALHGGIPVVSYHSNDETALNALEELKKINDRTLVLKFDVASQAAVKENVQKIIDQFGRIDILINNAGVTRDKLLFMMTEDEWDMVIDTNLIGALNCAEIISEHMKNEGGKIINIVSTGGIFPNVAQSNYSSSKSGLIEYTRIKAKELIKHNIQMNAVAPGFIETQMTSKMAPRFIAKYLGEIPLKRMGKVKEVSDAVMFFLSEQATYILGQTLIIDGGLTL